MLNQENYTTLHSWESIGGFIGALGIKILVQHAGLSEEALNSNDALRAVAYAASASIKDELIAQARAADPKAKEAAAEERKAMLALFGDQAIYVQEIPNGYDHSGQARHLPWFQVTTKIGMFTLGWRKRVINIDWANIDNPPKAEALFPEVTDTKGDFFIHAYGYEKAQEYIERIMGYVHPK